MKPSIRWGRVIVGGILVEVLLIAATIPIVMFSRIEDFLNYVPIACLVAGFVIGWWTARRVESQRLLHGFLVGLIATLIYFALNLGSSGSLTPVIEMYGPFLFYLSNGLRIVGCVAGAAAAKSPV
jgi:putative membrane protein (TIGR04086 family)